ncbi:diguanylate cyclase [Methylophilus rhizosphaerae]|uniref:diguanylate cyclase n=1 Tax=Methylophilus rhizosphaerae TaxID=492660 RepID=A0A1G9B159_9PROT|nr:GGDEF domain-containing protein [Methylophilus rhizosphaerae]SDK32565.1 diguanylate cyclase [Methylophilus rhizosphaerae]
MATNGIPTTASEIARETIKQMAVRRVEPTPDNYTRIYSEIAGKPVKEDAAAALRKALKQLPHDSLEQTNWINRWEKALKQDNWQGLGDLLKESMLQQLSHSTKWPRAIRTLLQGWEDKRGDIDPAQKREMLERVLINFGSDSTLPDKLLGMANNWLPADARVEGVPAYEGSEVGNTPVPPASVAAAITPLTKEELPAEVQQFHGAFTILQTLLKQTLHLGLVPRLEGYPDLQSEAIALQASAERAKKLKEWEALAKSLKALLLRVEMIGVQEDDVRGDIIDLLHLLLSNIGELVAEDGWLSGQVYAVQSIISGPLDRAKLKQAEKSLKEVVYKQGLVKYSLIEARNSFKSLIGSFIDKLKYMGEASEQYGGKIEHYAKELSQTDDLIKINELVNHLMRDTSVMQTDIMRSHDDLLQQQRIASETQVRMQKLQDELSQLSEVVRIDQLTGVLNRRGMEEAFNTEIARYRRSGESLSVALLDIDNFKYLNDQHGHAAGDSALKHLAAVVKRTVRPTDIVTRMGGEEFVVILPNTSLDEAVTTMSRLQRSLTKEYFLGNNQKLLVTFSAGVALFKQEDDVTSILLRADQAMYLAKKSGKNRVMTEVDLQQS